MGGISPLKKTLEYAAQYQIKSGMHGPTDISPVGMAAAMHLGLSIHNFGIQEYMRHSAPTDSVFQQSFTWADGYLHPGDEPGLGVDARRRRGRQVPLRAGLPALQPARWTERSTTGERPHPPASCVMGVSAAGKSTVGAALAETTGGAVPGRGRPALR